MKTKTRTRSFILLIKIIKLLLECNPNTIELLGLDENQYLIRTTLGQERLDHKNMLGVMNNVIREYDKIGKRNKKKDDNHFNKHAMRLIRLFMMAIDILEKMK